MNTVKFIDACPVGVKLKYSVIAAQYRGKWIFCRHKARTTWEIPGGHIEPGETSDQAAFRELWEETGLTARLDTTRQAVIEYPISPIARKQVVFFPGLVTGSPRTREGEIEAFRWVPAEELGNYLFPDTVAAIGSLLP